MLALTAARNHPRVDSSCCAALADAAQETDEDPREGERTDNAGLEEDPEPLVVENRRIRNGHRGSGVVTRVPYPSPTSGFGRTRVSGPGRASRSGRCRRGRFCLLRDSPAEGKNAA